MDPISDRAEVSVRQVWPGLPGHFLSAARRTRGAECVVGLLTADRQLGDDSTLCYLQIVDGVSLDTLGQHMTAVAPTLLGILGRLLQNRVERATASSLSGQRRVLAITGTSRWEWGEWGGAKNEGVREGHPRRFGDMTLTPLLCPHGHST
jgi:hypothetical protein